MDRLFLGLLVGLVSMLAACSPTENRTPLEGQNVGNGGDNLPKLFERGSAHAVRILERVEAIHVSSRRLKAWYGDNRLRLLADVRETPIVWVPSNANQACGLTGDKPRSTVFLSYERCRGIESVRAAAIHLIGESVHHFGVRDDAFTAAVAVAVAEAWERELGTAEGAVEKRLLFEQGRLHAREVLLRIQPESLPSTLSDLYTPEQRRWLLAHRETVAADVSGSRHVWVDGELSAGGDPALACVATAVKRSADVELSYSGCGDGIERREKAGMLLTEAALYQSLGDRAVARRLAHLVYAMWFNMGHPEMSHWLTLPLHSEKRFDVYEAVWTGSHLLAWSQYLHEVHFYDPRSNGWNRRAADSSRVARRRNGESPRWVADRLVIHGECRPDARNGAGLVYDPATNRWIAMSATGAPEERWFGTSTTVAAGGKLVVFGGLRGCSGVHLAVEDLHLTDFGIYDPRKDAWSTTKVEPRSVLTRDGTVAVDIGGRLIVWGGRQYSPEEKDFVVHNDGGIFDYGGRLVRPMTNDNAPAPRSWAKHAWTGSHLVVLGGYEVGDALGRPYRRAFVADGGIYDVAADRWTPMSLEGAPQLDGDQHFGLLWIGNEVLYVGRTVAYYNPLRNRWRTPPRTPTPLLLNPFRSAASVFWTGMEAVLWDKWSFGEKLSGYAFFP